MQIFITLQLWKSWGPSKRLFTSELREGRWMVDVGGHWRCATPMATIVGISDCGGLHVVARETRPATLDIPVLSRS